LRPRTPAEITAHRAEVERVRESLQLGGETERRHAYPRLPGVVLPAAENKTVHLAADPEVGTTTDVDGGTW
jgi:hypothetical protein